MKIQLNQYTAALISIFFCLTSPWIALARTIDITQDPYNASPSNPPVYNGASDNGTIINKAIQQLLSEGGGTLYIPAGNWQFATPIYITNHPTFPNGSNNPNCNCQGSLIIRGDGAHQRGVSGGTDLIFETYTGLDAFTCQMDYNNYPNNYIPRLYIRDLSIDGGTQSQVTNTYGVSGNRYGLVLYMAFYFNLSGVTVSGFSTAGILVDNAYWGAMRDVAVAYCNIGIDENQANACVRRNISVYGCSTGLHEPQAIIGGAIENSYNNGVIYDYNPSAILPYTGQPYDATYWPQFSSLHDCYFANNHTIGTGTGADIHAVTTDQGNHPVDVGLSGNCTFVGAGSNTSYLAINGNPTYITRLGATRFPTGTADALVDIAPSNGTVFIDASTQKNYTDVAWTQESASNHVAFLWEYGGQPNGLALTILP